MMQLEDEYPDPELAALQMLSKRAGMSTPDEDAPVTVAEQLTPAAPMPPPVTQQAPQAQMQAPATQQQARGFDWGRALTAFGGGDVGGYDANRRYEAEAPQRAMQQEAATIALENQRLQAQRARALMDPVSPESRQEQQAYAALMNARANAPGVPDNMKAQFAEQAGNASQMTAAQIARAKLTQDQIYGDMFKAIDSNARTQLGQTNMDLKQRGVAAQEAMIPVTIADKQHDNSVQSTLANETLRHNRVVEGRAAEAAAEGKLPPESNQKSYREAVDAVDQIDQALALLDKGKVRYTGAGAETANAVSSVLPGGMDPRNEDERALGGLVGELSAEKKHNLYGSVLSSGEQANSKQFVPSVSMNKETLKKSLLNLRDRARKHVEFNNQLYPKLGKAVTRSSDQPSPQAADPRVARAKAILADPNESPEKKAKAQKWLDAQNK